MTKYRKVIMYKYLIGVMVCLSPGLLMGQAESALVYVGDDNILEYIPYANTGETEEINIIPDFSYSGYKFGGVPLPEVPVVVSISPQPGDNYAYVQNIIDSLSTMPLDENGFRGAILFSPGKFEIASPLVVNASGIVLRGSGQKPASEGGTELYASMEEQHNLITFSGFTPSFSGSVLDTLFIPQNDGVQDGDIWLKGDVTDGVIQELEGDKTVSFYLRANNGEFVSYVSKEGDETYWPYLDLKVHDNETDKDTVMSLFPSDDSYTQRGDNQDNNYGTEARLSIKYQGDAHSLTREIFLKFQLPHSNIRVDSAYLNLWCNNAGNDDDQLNFIQLIEDDSWDENTITYANQPGREDLPGNVRIISQLVPVGAVSFQVQDASSFSVGDDIEVIRSPNQAWIDALDMGQYGWTPEYYTIQYPRKIVSISGNTIGIDIPVVQTMSSEYGGGKIGPGTRGERVNKCGVEDMMISSYYANDEDEKHGWIALNFIGTDDCWVKNVSAQFFGYSCVQINGANRTTVQDCAMLDPKSITTGGRKYSFVIQNGSFNLFQRCYTRGGRHDYVTGSRVAGPNAFIDCYAEETYADIGPHHRYATGILFDNIRGGETRVRNRGDSGTGHGWAGAQVMFWNLEVPYHQITVESPTGAMNWGIGCKGKYYSGDGFWENKTYHVLPRSLYLKQLEDRLGVEAVMATTTEAQRNGRIYDVLEEWKGIGIPVDSLPSNNSVLYDLKVNEATIEGFAPNILDYIYAIEEGGNAPDIEAIPYDSLSSVDVAFKEADNIFIITVSAQDGLAQSVYTLTGNVPSIITDNQSLQFEIYPNPFQDDLYVNLGDLNYKEMQIYIYNSQGVKMLSLPCTSERIKISMDSFSVGIYHILINDKSGTVYNTSLLKIRN